MGKEIYFVKSGDYVKIGNSSNIKERLTDLQTGNPEPLELLYSYPINNKRHKPTNIEDAHHYKFRKHHHCNEWFHLSNEIKNYIEKIKVNPRCRIKYTGRTFKKREYRSYRNSSHDSRGRKYLTCIAFHQSE